MSILLFDVRMGMTRTIWARSLVAYVRLIDNTGTRQCAIGRNTPADLVVLHITNPRDRLLNAHVCGYCYTLHIRSLACDPGHASL